jgi:glycine C-acetyltransferase
VLSLEDTGSKMPNSNFDTRTQQLLSGLRDSGQYKELFHVTSPMGATARLEGVGEVIVFCSNNYLGLADHPEVIEAAHQGLRDYGAGTASVRFICGTLACHRTIEKTIARFVGTEAALTYVSAWNANEAVIPTAAGAEDVFISDELNHASIIDAMRLLRGAEKAVYRHGNLEELEARLQQHRDKACRWVVTDGVFSMEGAVAKLPQIQELCRQYQAMLILDDSHGHGVLGETGRGTAEFYGLLGQIDVITGTLGKALGGAAGGFVAGKQHLVDLLIQRSRPSLFSNALPATVAYSANRAIEIVEREPQRVKKLHNNVKVVREGLKKLGFDVHGSPSAIIPIIIGDTAEAIRKSRRLLELGVWVVAFGFPVVPQGQARLRVQVSAALEPHHIQKALDAFAQL